LVVDDPVVTPELDELPFTGIEDHLGELAAVLVTSGVLILVMARGRKAEG
jgi:hypothetical protein